jgi:hypothetical protein
MQFLGYERKDGFRTYDELWRYVLSSPLAHPALFMPDATNAENRSRDKNRTMVVKFQEWVSAYAILRPAPARATWRDALARLHDAHKSCWHSTVMKEKARRIAMAEERARRVAAFGRGAVQEVFGAGLNQDTVGRVIHGMQAHLPEKEEREGLFGGYESMAKIMGRLAARASGLAMGLVPLDAVDGDHG